MQVSSRKRIPASPRSIHRFLSELPKCTFAFSRMQPSRYPDNPEREHLIYKFRTQTMLYRNLLDKEDCATVIPSIFRMIDKHTIRELGFAFSEMFSALVALAAKVEGRLNVYLDRGRDGFKADSEAKALKTIEFFVAISHVAARVSAKYKSHCTTLDLLRWSAFQLCEICYAWPFILDKAELRGEFGNDAVAFFERISLRPGALASANPEHFFMDNPVWRRPFVELDEHSLFLPLPNLFYGFPFQIFEQFLVGRRALEQAYSDARAKFLEDSIEARVSTAMPSARTYQGVMWCDDASGTLYENDVVALIGNTLFLFEAKSGRLDDVARRGGELRLVRNFKELFVAPGEQARRLENYLNRKGKDARLWVKNTNKTVELDLDKPKVVHKFSICIEHFAALTSAKHNLTHLRQLEILTSCFTSTFRAEKPRGTTSHLVIVFLNWGPIHRSFCGGMTFAAYQSRLWADARAQPSVARVRRPARRRSDAGTLPLQNRIYRLKSQIKPILAWHYIFAECLTRCNNINDLRPAGRPLLLKISLRVLGVIKDEDAWAPVLSLGELMLIWRYLDTEISFFHYLTRRATLEDLVDFEGDEQDILSTYLTNGLCIDWENFQGRQLQFLNVDGVVRAGKTPRRDRTEFEKFRNPTHLLLALNPGGDLPRRRFASPLRQPSGRAQSRLPRARRYCALCAEVETGSCG